jgi:redox-sensitive bicupin YhaK (pirin superfamily)
MRTIKEIHKASFSPIADLVTYSPLPSRSLRQIDPFLFLNHHGPQVYPPQNHGLPFGPHPHRGMETVTFIIDGDIMHKDSGGHESIITAGGVQYMTAGRGLIHAEVSSEHFKEKGGPLEILQLWVNLPARLKMTDPQYTGLQQDQIPAVKEDEDKATIRVVSGVWNGTPGALHSATGVSLYLAELGTDATLSVDIPVDENIFFYVVRGTLQVNGREITKLHLAEFENDATELHIVANADSILLLGHAKPFNEPLVARGPFVMNTEAEIMQAYKDYEAGLFGTFV